MQIRLYINNELCHNLTQLQEHLKGLSYGSEIFSDILEYALCGDLSIWLCEHGHEELGNKIDSLDQSASDSEYMTQLADLLTGKTSSISKPRYTNCFSCDISISSKSSNEVSVLLYMTPIAYINENFEIKVSCGWGTKARVFNPSQYENDITNKEIIVFHRRNNKEIGPIVVAIDGEQVFNESINEQTDKSERNQSVSMDSNSDCNYLNDDELKDFLLNLIDFKILEWNEDNITLHLYFPQTIMNCYREIFRKNDLIDTISDEEYDINLSKTIELSCKELPGWPSKLPEYETFKFYLSFLKNLFFKNANGDIHIRIPKQKLCACFGIKERVGGIIIPRNDIEQHYSLNILELGFKNSGLEIIKQPFEIHRGQSELLAYRYQGKYGFISKDGKIHTMPLYDDAGCFNWDLAPVKKDGKYGYIDPLGNEVIPFVYSYATVFSHLGVATVIINGSKKGIRTDGTLFELKL